MTAGALESGLQKSMLLIGLVFTSLFSVTPGLRLPGILGGVLGRMFYYFEELSAGKGKIRRKSFIKDIDAVLGSCRSESSIDSGSTVQKGNDIQGESRRIPAAVSVVLLFYAIWIISFVL